MATGPESMQADWSRGAVVLRAWAILLVVLLHAALPYAVGEAPSLRWALRTPAGQGFDAVFWWAYAYATPLFSVLSGFLAAGSLERRGVGAFAGERAGRLGVPLLAGVVIVLPLTYLVWLWAWTRQGLANPEHVLMGNFAPGLERSMWGLGHLWYLQYLLVITLGYAAWRWARPARSVRPGRALAVGALLTGGIVMVWPEVLADFRNSFVPEGPKLAYHTAFFGVGAAWWGWRDQARALTRAWWLWLVAAGGAYLGLLTLVQEARSGWEPWLAVCGTVFTWGSIAGMIGFAARLPVPAWADRTSRASFGVYLMHLPVLVALQVAAAPLGVSAWVKGGACVLLTLASCQIAWELLSRWRYGWVLGGERVPGRSGPAVAQRAADAGKNAGETAG